MSSWLHSIRAGDEGRAKSLSTAIATKQPEGSGQRRAGGLASPEAAGPGRLERD